MTAPAPTPLPWHTGGIAGRSPIVYAANGRPVANTTVYWSGSEQPDMHANADLIVRAVNAHDELVAALRACASCLAAWTEIQDDEDARDRDADALDAAAALLARLDPTTPPQAAQAPHSPDELVAALRTVVAAIDAADDHGLIARDPATLRDVYIATRDAAKLLARLGPADDEPHGARP